MTSILMLSSSLCVIWTMRMEVFSEANGLWWVIVGTIGSFSHSHLFPEFSIFQLDIKKTMKENWEVLQTLHVGVDHVI